MEPSNATWHVDRAEAGIAKDDPRFGPCTPHSARKSYSTWLDGLNIPRGLVTHLMRHAGTLAERRYIKHGATDPEAARRAIESLPPLWPEAIDLFSIRGTKKLAKHPEMSDTGAVTRFGSSMTITPTHPREEARTVSVMDADCVTTRPESTGPVRVSSRGFDHETPSPSNPPQRASDSFRNGQIPEPIDTQNRVALALALWLERQGGGSKEPARDTDKQDD